MIAQTVFHLISQALDMLILTTWTLQFVDEAIFGRSDIDPKHPWPRSLKAQILETSNWCSQSNIQGKILSDARGIGLSSCQSIFASPKMSSQSADTCDEWSCSKLKVVPGSSTVFYTNSVEPGLICYESTKHDFAFNQQSVLQENFVTAWYILVPVDNPATFEITSRS